MQDDEIVMVVNNVDITTSQFKKVFDSQKKIFKVNSSKKIKPEELVWLKNRVLDEIVMSTLLYEEIKKNHINIEENILRETLKEAREGYSEQVFSKALELEGVSKDEWENAIKTNLLINKLIKKNVNSKVDFGEREMQVYFNENIKKFHKKKQVRALHIMVETEDDIRQVKKELKGKQKSFSVLAKEFSLGPEGARGGDLGYFEVGQMPEEFDDVFKLKKGKVSEIIKTPYGFHLFKVIDKISERKMNFDESKNKIRKILLQDFQDKAFKDWFYKLKNNSRIKVNYELLQKIY